MAPVKTNLTYEINPFGELFRITFSDTTGSVNLFANKTQMNDLRNKIGAALNHSKRLADERAGLPTDVRRRKR